MPILSDHVAGCSSWQADSQTRSAIPFDISNHTSTRPPVPARQLFPVAWTTGRNVATSQSVHPAHDLVSYQDKQTNHPTRSVQDTQAFPARVFRAGGPGQALIRHSSPSTLPPIQPPLARHPGDDPSCRPCSLPSMTCQIEPRHIQDMISSAAKIKTFSSGQKLSPVCRSPSLPVSCLPLTQDELPRPSHYSRCSGVMLNSMLPQTAPGRPRIQQIAHASQEEPSSCQIQQPKVKGWVYPTPNAAASSA